MWMPVMWWRDHSRKEEDPSHIILRDGSHAQPVNAHLGHSLSAAMEDGPRLSHQYFDGERWLVHGAVLATPLEDAVEICPGQECRTCPLSNICDLGGVPFGKLTYLRCNAFHFKKSVLDSTLEVIPHLTVYGVGETVVVHAPEAFRIFPQFTKPEQQT